MAAAGRAIAQVVRLHAPLIKFPNRLSDPTPYVQEVLKMGVAAAQQSSGTHSSPMTSALVPLTRLPGTPDTAATIRDLPQRYRRRIVAPEEMEYIQRGGPE
ncbi:28S ribosomal protein S36, mitochondrial isoform X2 [Coregonus clupeaformis]|uniref:28S ribosomal protein S36, mitochondrial isoform X2 n=1 Tax=Coregonus clupeaformis TaxID=59861 RepID=UPI001BE0434D|nr:28S ribosomal protein S36, mitochondrial isoform X2 [Coregonus clupeaformis]